MKRLMPAVKTGLLLFAAGALLYIFATFRPGARPAQAPVPAPDFTFPDLKGHPVSFSSFKGRTVLLDFWATWCGPCQEELPDLIALQRKFEKKNFTILGVSLDTGGSRLVSAFVRNHQVPYPVLLSDGEPPEGYPVPGLPAAFLVDSHGMILRRYLGPQSYEDLAKDVEAALAR